MDTTKDYQKREGVRFLGYGIIFSLIFIGLFSIARGDNFKTGIILIFIGVSLWYLSRSGDKRNKKIFGRY